MNRVFSRVGLLATTGVAALAMGAAPAWAQTGPQTSPPVGAPAPQEPEMPDEPQRNAEALPLDPVSETNGPEIVVTGSFIRGSAENTALPIDVIGGEEMANRGTPSTLDLIKALPTSSGVLGDSNQFDARSAGAEGSGSINLRALGAERTLVLLNGRRLAFNPVPATSGGVVDTNLIPSAAIGRVEVLKDGAAALYGSDAIAGVVNFITRTDLRGLTLGGNLRLIDGSDGDWTLSGAYGNKLGDLRLFLSAGYQHRSPLEAIKRNFTRVTYLENPNGGYTPVGNPGTYVPLGASFSPIGTPRRDVNCASLNGFPGFTGTTPACYSQSVQFDNLVEEEDRYQIFGSLSYEFSKAFEVYVEGLYARTEIPRALTSPSQAPVQLPSFEATGDTRLAGRFFVPISNPGYQSYVAANPGVFPIGTAGVQLVAYRPFFLGGNPLFTTTGGAESMRETDAFRVSGGFRGELSSAVRYDLSATYMEDISNRTSSDVLANRLQLALIGLGGPNCDSSPGQPGIQGTPGVGGCVYFNPFSTAVQFNPQQGGANPQFNSSVANSNELVGWFYQTFANRSKSSLLVLEGVVNGTTGITLPGGPIGWAVGGQYRKSTYSNRGSDLVDPAVTPCLATPDFFVTNCALRNGPLTFSSLTTPVNLSGDVYGAFAELSLPIFDTLAVQAAARYEDYGGGVGSTFNPKIAAKWDITGWLAIRGSLSTTFRGPPLIATDPNPTTTLQNVRGVFRAVDNFGSSNLKPESATAYNVGVLIDTGGFRASVDYYTFKLRNTLSTEPIGALASMLYPSNTTNRCSDPVYAQVLARFTFQDLNGNGTVDDCAAGNIARVRVNTINGAPVDINGLDFAASYTIRDLLGAQVTIGADATWTLNYDVAALRLGDLTLSTAFDAVGKLNFQTTAYPLPEWKGMAFINVDAGRHNLRLSVRYSDSYEDQRTDIFSPSTNYSPNGQQLVTMLQGKVVSSWTVVDIVYRLRLPGNLEISMAIDNVFDKDPPFSRQSYSYDPFIANGLGSTFKFGINKKF